ncbi:unnamed protein product [Toxocara canis]|uniref:Dirigent protein n=1 Tax=Toxocara canis TaxID=6265 RepID=A0A183VE93_TOXCA|nr:unnamed protein product [Toxocara canis]
MPAAKPVLVGHLRVYMRGPDQRAEGNNANHIPSLKEIEDLEDADLLDIFKSSNLGTTRPPEPQFLSLSTLVISHMQMLTAPPFSSNGFIERNNEGRRESIPIERNRGFETPMYHSTFANAPFSSAAYTVGSNLGQLASSGAQVFVSGAEHFGRAFGVDTGRLSSNLFDMGSAFLGRKK